MFRASHVKPAAWKLIEFLSQPEQQVDFFDLVGNLPANLEAWEVSQLSSHDKYKAFHQQLQHTAPMPRVPEWEAIAWQLSKALEDTINGKSTLDKSLAALDREVDQILVKRRWMLDRQKPAQDAK